MGNQYREDPLMFVVTECLRYQACRRSFQGDVSLPGNRGSMVASSASYFFGLSAHELQKGCFNKASHVLSARTLIVGVPTKGVSGGHACVPAGGNWV